MTINDSTNQEELQVCPVCQVSIDKLDRVKFSSGQMGTRARLYARVCQYVNKPECINQDPQLIGEITQADRFSSGENLKNQLDETLNG